MTIEVKVPMLPESVADATVLTWHKQTGDAVNRDETIVELETDKVVLEVPSPSTGILSEVRHNEGDTVTAQDILAMITPGETKAPASVSDAPSDVSEPAPQVDVQSDLSPSVRRLVAEHGINISELSGSGKHGRILKEDVERFIQQASPSATPAASDATTPTTEKTTRLREEKRVPMSRFRAKVAERLLQAQHNAAMLTTFNEVNMQAVIDLRKKYQEQFVKEYDVKLGFMSFFTKATIEALKRFPAVNASIDGSDIVYHGYYDIGMAVSTDRGLVVPVIRNAQLRSMSQIEQDIMDFAKRARANKLSLEELQGGTFTITNGGIFGSLLSTPILNPPQVGILGMHKIEERPIVENGQVVVRPMMYLALSYDHRLIDGRESVQFLKTIKECLEDPARLLLNI